MILSRRATITEKDAINCVEFPTTSLSYFPSQKMPPHRTRRFGVNMLFSPSTFVSYCDVWHMHVAFVHSPM